MKNAFHSLEQLAATGAKFRTIYADPPWRYRHCRTSNRRIENHYETMTLDEICSMDVAAIADRDCMLFLWTTAPKLRESMDVIDAWGFDYRTGVVWDKVHIGMGYYFRGRHEHLLLGVKGQPGVPLAEFRCGSVIVQERGRHSKKPHVFRDIVENIGPEPRIELFGREARPGWTVMGNQIDAQLFLQESPV